MAIPFMAFKGRVEAVEADVGFKLAIVVVALALRLFVTGYFQGFTSPPDPGWPDPTSYVTLAQTLATKGRFELDDQPSLHYPPGVPFILVPAFALCQHGYAGARVLFCLLGALTCLPLYTVTARVGGRTAGRIAAACLAAYPEHFYWSMHFTPEVPVGLFLMLSLSWAQRVDEQPSWAGNLVLGGLFACQALITPRMLLLFPVFLLLRVVVQFRRARGYLAKSVVTTTLGAVLILSPWTVRNYLVSGKFILVSSLGGPALLIGNNPLVLSNPNLLGSWYQGPMEDIPGWSAIRHLPAEDRDREAKALALNFIRSLPPTELFTLELMKLYRFLSPFVESPNRAYRIIIGTSWGMLAPIALVGLVAVKRNAAAYGMYAVVAAYTLIALVFYGEARYRASISPVLVGFGALGACLVWYGYRSRRSRAVAKNVR